MAFHARTILIAPALVLSLLNPAWGQHALQQRQPDWALLSSAAFLGGHPDLRYRQWADHRYRVGDHGQALQFYRRAARYADKHSQARIAEMLWLGESAAQDRALAYAWMNLAAERGYPAMLARRERFWSELSQSERDRALREGAALYAQYGDEVTQPRMERALFSGRRKMIGSRTGSIQAGDVCSPASRTGQGVGLLGGIDVALSEGGNCFKTDRFYDRAYWEPEHYWQWQRHLSESNYSSDVVVGEPAPSAPEARD